VAGKQNTTDYFAALVYVKSPSTEKMASGRDCNLANRQSQAQFTRVAEEISETDAHPAD
jgi:hypothetical protein